MKKIIIILTILVTLSSYAQREVIEYRHSFDNKRFHFGYYLGINNNDYKISYTEADRFIDVNAKMGFIVGIVGGIKLHKNLALRLEPGLMTNTKTLTYTYIEGTDRDRIREVPGTYLHIPLLLKINTNRLGNIRPYVIGGVSYDYNFSSNENNPDDNAEGEFRMKTSNYSYEIGIGIDIYTYYFICSPSIRGVFTMNDELVYDADPNSPWTGSLDGIQTRGVFLKLTFH